MRYLVIGGGGYVGSHVCKQLRGRRIDHVALDDFSTGHPGALHETPYITADIADSAAVEHAFAEVKPTAIIHLAAIASLPACDAEPARAEAVNIDGTRHILDAMAKHRTKRIAFASSCGVYAATPKPRALNEKDPPSPPSHYGRTKLAGEKLLQDYHANHGLAYTALRIFNVAGADADGIIGERHEQETHLLPLVLNAILTGTPLQLFGNDYSTPDGTAVRDYIHVEDVAESFLRAVELKEPSAILNAGTGVPTSVLQMIAVAEKVTGKKVPYTIAPRRSGDAAYLLADTSLCVSTLHFTPKRSELSTLVASAWRWHSHHS